MNLKKDIKLKVLVKKHFYIFFLQFFYFFFTHFFYFFLHFFYFFFIHFFLLIFFLHIFFYTFFFTVGNELVVHESGVGFMGHLLQISTIILEGFKIDKFSDNILKDLERNEKWNNFCEKTILQLNMLHN